MKMQYYYYKFGIYDPYYAHQTTQANIEVSPEIAAVRFPAVHLHEHGKFLLVSGFRRADPLNIGL